jgi:hypothetical protein
MPHKKVLFLDIDGVVLPNKAAYLPNQTKPLWKIFDPCAVALLNNICHRSRWKIVIHSSWLRYWTVHAEAYNSVKDYCIGQGIKAGHFHDDAECRSDISWRYDRVDEWLSRHPEITRYVILDDTAPPSDYPRIDHWIKCNADEGITLDIHTFLTNYNGGKYAP